MSLSAGQIVVKGIKGEKFTKDEILAIYGNPENWGKIYDEKGCHWVWQGPVICPFEAAQWILE